MLDTGVYACGDNRMLQFGVSLGNNNNNSHPYTSFVKVPLYIDRISNVCCGSNHTIFLLNDGKVASCGDNSYWQTGYSVLQYESYMSYHELIPDLYFGGKKVKHAACGHSFTLFVTEDNMIYGVGQTYFGQLVRRSS